MFDSLLLAPTYHLALEGCLLMCVLWLIFHKSYRPEPSQLTEQVFNNLFKFFVQISIFFLFLFSFILKNFFCFCNHQEKEELINEWTPEPLVPNTPSDHYALNPRIVTSKLGKRIVIEGKECLNLATHNYLGFVENQDCIDAAIKGLRKYGVGSCGPRGFYGTVGEIHFISLFLSNLIYILNN